MKNKIIHSLIPVVVAILGLSGCGGSSGDRSLLEVDISLLHEGYSVSGTYASSDPATFEYCNDVVTMIADGTRDGTFSLDVNDVNMSFTPNDNRYLVAEIIDDGVYVLKTGGTYDTVDRGLFTITKISTINCELLPR